MRIQIRRKTRLDGHKGFIVMSIGDHPMFRAAIYTQFRSVAERLKEKLLKGQEITLDDYNPILPVYRALNEDTAHTLANQERYERAERPWILRERRISRRRESGRKAAVTRMINRLIEGGHS